MTVTHRQRKEAQFTMPGSGTLMTIGLTLGLVTRPSPLKMIVDCPAAISVLFDPSPADLT